MAIKKAFWEKAVSTLNGYRKKDLIEQGKQEYQKLIDEINFLKSQINTLDQQVKDCDNRITKVKKEAEYLVTGLQNLHEEMITRLEQEVEEEKIEKNLYLEKLRLVLQKVTQQTKVITEQKDKLDQLHNKVRA